MNVFITFPDLLSIGKFLYEEGCAPKENSVFDQAFLFEQFDTLAPEDEIET